MTICRIGAEYIIVSDKENFDTTRVISLNATAAHLWEEAKELDFTPEMMAGKMCEVYDVDYERALADVNKTLAIWQENGLLE